MATQILTDLSNLPFSWWITKGGQDVKPAVTGRLGAFPIGTKLKINILIPDEVHQCYTIDPNDPSKHFAKKSLSDGLYEKNITITEGNGIGLAPRWPNNILGLDVADRHFTLGINQQYGIFYFVIEEYTEDSVDKIYLPGEVRWFSALRGFGAVASDNPLFDFKIHWSACPKRDSGLRFLNSGEKITWDTENITNCGSSSKFLREIKDAELVH
jgi:cold shock CspA family protein